jgi:hypothetical protein
MALVWAYPAAAAVTASPMNSEGGAMPRLTAFPNAKVKARVNAQLAQQEKRDRAAQADCKQQVADEHLDARFYNYEETAEVVWLTPHYMSVRIVTSWNCGGAHPDGETSGLTFDLYTGAALDWARVFKPGYKDGLRALYQARYVHTDPACRDVVANDFPSEMSLWLDRRAGGLAVEPVFAHAVQGCGGTMTFDADTLAPLIVDRAFLADLKG